MRPVVTPALEADQEDWERFLRLMRHGSESWTPLPDKPRDYAEWLNLGTAADAEFVRAELRVSAQLGATYYATPTGTRAVAEAVRTNENTTIAIARQFAKLREGELRELSSIVGRRAFPLQPPMILAYAAASAETLDGLIAALRDLRNDGQLARLRRYAASLAEMSAAELISAAKEIDRELRRILDPSSSEVPNLVDTLFSVVDVSGGELLRALLQAGPGFLQRLGIRRHLAFLGEVHRVVPDVEHFYADLTRVLAPPDFSLPDLVDWLRTPEIANLAGLRSKQLVAADRAKAKKGKEEMTLSGSIAEINRLIVQKRG